MTDQSLKVSGSSKAPAKWYRLAVLALVLGVWLVAGSTQQAQAQKYHYVTKKLNQVNRQAEKDARSRTEFNKVPRWTPAQGLLWRGNFKPDSKRYGRRKARFKKKGKIIWPAAAAKQRRGVSQTLPNEPRPAVRGSLKYVPVPAEPVTYRSYGERQSRLNLGYRKGRMHTQRYARAWWPLNPNPNAQLSGYTQKNKRFYLFPWLKPKPAYDLNEAEIWETSVNYMDVMAQEEAAAQEQGAATGSDTEKQQPQEGQGKEEDDGGGGL